MKCEKCGKNHEESHPHFKLVKKLTDKGFPTHEKKYKEAHEKANKAEKRKFGVEAFRNLEAGDRKMGKHDLAGKNTKKGKIEVSRRVPKNDRREVAYHEEVENKILRKKK